MQSLGEMQSHGEAQPAPLGWCSSRLAALQDSKRVFNVVTSGFQLHWRAGAAAFQQHRGIHSRLTASTTASPLVPCYIRSVSSVNNNQCCELCYEFLLALYNATCFVKMFRVLRCWSLTRTSHLIAPSVAAFTRLNSTRFLPAYCWNGIAGSILSLKDQCCGKVFSMCFHI